MEHKYIKQIFERADLQQVREFLICGLDPLEPDKRTYAQRLEDSSINILNTLKRTSNEDDELDRAGCYLGDATETYRDVFLEIGMKAGARLMFQLLCEN